MTERTPHGPWSSNGKGSWVCVFQADGGLMQWEVEYRRAEPGQQAGWYLFGPGFDGLLLDACTAVLARYEAFWRLMERNPIPSPLVMGRLVTGVACDSCHPASGGAEPLAHSDLSQSDTTGPGTLDP